MNNTPELKLPKKYSPEPIAIVGLGCVMPDAHNIDQFWQNIISGKDSIIEVPKDRWDPELFYDPDPDVPDKTYTKLGSFVRDFELNPIEYRIPPNVLEQIDPVQQWALKSAKEALEDANYESEDFPNERCAVIIGNSLGGEKSFELSQRVYFPSVVSALKNTNQFKSLSAAQKEEMISQLENNYKDNIPVINEDSMPGELANIVAGRIAAVFNLRGKNMTSDAACASSLAAIDVAYKGLQAHEFDAAVVGGSDRSNDPPSYVKFSKIGALSADGSFPFDERANGFVPGEGAGVMVVKRLSEALEADDKIYALITGVGSSSDGKGKGITAPNPIGQELAIRRALEAANLEPEDIQLVEAHGTSTSVGDYVEVSTIESVYKEHGVKANSVKLGSIKSQIGHLKSAAGAAGLLKTALSIHHKTYPPSINFETPNSRIDWEKSPFVVNTETRNWDDTNGIRRAAVSSFGFGGTNFHVIMEEYDPSVDYDLGDKIYAAQTTKDPTTPSLSYREYVKRNKDLEAEPLLVSASNSDELENQLDKLDEKLPAKTVMDDMNAQSMLQIIEILSFNSTDEYRVGITPNSLDEVNDQVKLAKGALDDESRNKLAQARGVFVSKQLQDGKTAFVFPGQGSQYADMMADLYNKYQIVKDTFDEADEILEDMLDKPLSEYILRKGRTREEVEEELRQTQITQPAVLTADIALFRLLQEIGITFEMTAGHSLGEYAALVAAEVLRFEDALKAVAIRGKAMSEVDAEDKGTMASVTAPIETVEIILDDVDGYVIAANKNSLTSTVISGSTAGVEEAVKKFKEEDINTVQLSVSAAFHTEIVEPAAKPLSEFLDEIEFNKPTVPITSNVTGDFFPEDPEEIRELMKQQVGAAVEWTKQTQAMFERGATAFFEVGPKRALSTFISDILEDEQILSVICNHPKKGGIKTFNEAIAAGFALGEEINIPSSAGPMLRDEFRWPQPGITFSSEKQKPRKTSKTTKSTDRPTPEDVGKQVMEASYGDNGNFEEFINKTLDYLQDESGKVKRFGMNTDKIVVSGIGVGLPGKHKEVFEERNVERIIEGENLIDNLDKDKLEDQLNKNIRRLIKKSSGNAEFHHPSGYEEVINLAGQQGKFNLIDEYKVDEGLASTYDIATELAVGAGLEALKDAGIPLVREYKKTTTGSYLPGDWILPEELQDSTGVIFASAFPGYDSFAEEITDYKDFQHKEKASEMLTNLYGEVSRRVKDEDAKQFLLNKLDDELDRLENDYDDFIFNRKILLEVLSMGHSQFAQLIKAKGPNTQINAACASTTQAVGMANDWIRNGRCDRVIIISADNITSDNLFQWLGSGFLASGAASIKDKVEEAALPFDRRRGGMIIGMGAAGLMVETETACRERGVTPIVEILGTHFANSAYHGTRLDVNHVSSQLQEFMNSIKQAHGVTPDEISQSLMFMSHETYTPRRGGSAAAEIKSLRETFGDKASDIKIANTKGFTGHPMGAGIEDAIAIKSIEYGKIPPIANFKEPDPDLGNLNLSMGENTNVDYALRLAAGFGSQIAFVLYKRRANGDRFGTAYENWLSSLGGNRDDLFHDGKTLKLKDNGVPEQRVVSSNQSKTSSSGSKIKQSLSQSSGISKSSGSSRPSQATTISKSTSGTTDLDESQVKSQIIDLVAESTGYPTDMIEPDLDLEADLGIDTVKQAETFGEIREMYGIPMDDNLAIADYPTINHIVDFVMENAGSSEIDISSKSTPSSTSQTKTTSKTTSSLDKDEIREKITQLVADSTGYPTDMIEPDLDLEADLGIDTVKQAETFGEIREMYGIPMDDDLAIADYPTINHIVDFVLDNAGDADIGSTTVDTKGKTSTTTKSSDMNKEEIRQEITQLVADQTGYPTDMIEPDLDLEADLGIDTVKQAETFGDIREKYGIPLEDDLAIADYPTINHIVDYVLENVDKIGTSTDTKSSQTTEVSTDQKTEDKTDHSLQHELFKIISSHTGYPVSMMDKSIQPTNDLGVDKSTMESILNEIDEQYSLDRSSVDKDSSINEIINAISQPEVDTQTKTREKKQKKPVKSSQPINGNRDKVIDIISTHTGYPSMMLDDDVNLQSDLGVDDDTIGDIVTEITTEFGTDSQELSTANTIGDLVSQVGPSQEGEHTDIEETDTKDISKEMMEMETSESIGENLDASSVEEVRKTLTQVIADKTGYPKDMLDPDADLEADLGIDSIKSAEIFGETRQKYGIPQIEDMDISELTTINKLSEFLYDKAQEIPTEAEKKIETKEHISEGTEDQANTHRYVIRYNQVDQTSEFSGDGIILANRSPGDKIAETLDMSRSNDLSVDKIPEKSVLLIDNPQEDLIGSPSKLFEFLKENIDLFSKLVLTLKKKEDTEGPSIHALSGLQGAIGGMFKSLANEFDIEAKIIIYEDVAQIPTEINNEGVEIVFHDKKRYEAVLSEENLDTTDWKLPEEAVVLASGGAQGITFQIINEIATEGNTFVLLGRTQIRDDAKEIANLSGSELDDRKMEFMNETRENHPKLTPVEIEKRWRKITKSANVYENVGKLEEMGCKVHYKSVDVTNEEGIREAFEELRTDMDDKLNITHFIHGAGVEISRPTKSKSVDEFELVYDVKVNGFEYLLQELRMDQIDTIVAFSSVAGRFGNASQIDYSGANEYLAKRCTNLNKKGTRAFVIDWSAWAEVGMATRGSTMKVLESQGVTPIPPEEGIQRFRDEMAMGEEPEVIISGELGALANKTSWFDPDYKKGIMIDEYSGKDLKAIRNLNLDKDLYLDDHRIDDTAVLPGAMGLEAMAEFVRATTNQEVSNMYNVSFSSPVKLMRDDDLEIHVIGSRLGKSLQLDLKSKFIGPDGNQLGDLREHFSARFRYDAKVPGYPVISGSELGELTKRKVMEKNEIYDVFFHGPSYQVLEKLNQLSEIHSVATFDKPEMSMFEEEVNLEIDPLVIEAAFQTAGLHLLTTQDTMALPAGIGSVNRFETNSEPSIIRAIYRSSTDTHSYYDVEVIDKNGDIHTLLTNYEMVHTGDIEPLDVDISEASEKLQAIHLASKLSDHTLSLDTDALEDVSEDFLDEFLTMNEKSRFSGIQVKKKREEWLAGRIIAKLLLAKTYNTSIKGIEILTDENRSPYAMINRQYRHVSITHSNGVATAIVGNKAVDMEKIEERSDAFIEQSFSAEERETFNLEEAPPRIVDTLWTVKEAHLKRMRIGLKENLHKVDITKQGDEIYLVSSKQGKSICHSISNDKWVITISEETN